MWTVESVGNSVASIRIESKRNREWRCRFLLSSDRHHDNPKTDQGMEKRHLEQAREMGAGVMDFGDLFCAMQGKYDKRSSKSDLRPEHQNGRYLDSLVDTAAEFYRPYADLFAVIGTGNHETSIKQRHETCLTSRLVDRLKTFGSPVVQGGYSGWIVFSFTRDGVSHKSIKLWYDHGYGGGGPVTKDIIQASRRAVYLPDADIVVSGHTHDRWIFPIERERITQQMKRSRDTQTHVKIPSYKDSWRPEGNWEKERGMPPKPVGAIWLEFTQDWKGVIDYEITFAK